MRHIEKHTVHTGFRFYFHYEHNKNTNETICNANHILDTDTAKIIKSVNINDY